MYKLNEDGVFVTESEQYIYVSVGEKHYKLNYSEKVNLRLRKVLSDILSEGNSKDKFLLEYLVNINAIVKKSYRMSINFDKIEIKVNNVNISKVMRKICKNKPEYRVSISNKAKLYCYILPNGKGVIIYKNKDLFKNYCWDDSNISEVYVEYLLAVIDKLPQNNKYSELLKKEILCISLENYDNVITSYCLRNFDFFMSDIFSDIIIDNESLYPLLIYRYRNILGLELISAGYTKEECMDDIKLQLSKIPYYNKFSNYNKNIGLKPDEKDMKILSFYFSNYSVNFTENNVYEINGSVTNIFTFSELVRELIKREEGSNYENI